MQEQSIKKLKFIYLLILILGLVCAIVYGFQRALEVYFVTRFQAPWGVVTDVYRVTRPIFRFLYMFFFTLAFPMLVTIQNYQLSLESKKDPAKCTRNCIIKLILENISAILVCILVFFVFDPFLSGGKKPFLWVYELIIFALIIGYSVNLPKIANTVNNDIQEFHLGGYHIHESVFGIFFMVAALLFIFNASTSLVDLIYACLFLVTGGFLFGRDIKDVMQGKFIEKVKKESESESREQRLA